MDFPRPLKLSLLLCALTLCLGVKAQNPYMDRPDIKPATFYGQLVDSLSKEPLPAAVISVMTRDYDGNRIVRNFVSDEKGGFRFTCTYTPYHRMEVAMLGYKPYVRNLNMDKEDQNLGVILLSQSTQAIDEVVVKSRLQMYKMKGDTIIFMPRAVNTMRDDAALEILRQMPGVEVTEGGGVKILGQNVERTYVNEKLLFGDDPTAALRELDAKEVASIEAYDEVDEADAVANGANARKRKVLNVVTFKDFTQSYSATVRGEMGADFHKNAEEERALRYLATGNVNFFSEALQFNASGGADNLTAGGNTPNSLFQRQSYARANVSGKSSNNQHRYNAGYSYGGDADEKRTSSTSDFFATDYFTSQRSEDSKYSESKSSNHTLSGGYNYTGEQARFETSLNARLSNGRDSELLKQSLVRDGKAVTATDVVNNNRCDYRFLDWKTSGGWRFKDGNSVSVSARANLSGGQSRGVRLERRTTAGVETPLEWDTYIPVPENSASGDVDYTFNFGKAGNLILGSGVQYVGRKEHLLYTNLQTGELDLVRSENAFDKTTTWNIGPWYRLRGKEYNISAYLDYKLENRVYDDAKAGRVDRRNFHFVTGSFSYNINRPKKTYNFSLSNDYRSVQARYFSSRINDTNPLYVSTGNRSLEPEKNYTFSFHSEFIGEVASYGFHTQLTAVTDPIISRRRFFKEETTLPEYDNYRMLAGSTLTSPENGAAYLQFTLGANYKVRIAPLRLFLDMGCRYSFSNSEEMQYDKRERIARHIVDLDTRITTNFSSRFRINVYNRAGVILMNRFGNSSRDFRDVLTGTMEWDIIKNLYLKADYMGIFSTSSGLIPTPSTHLLNLSLGCRVLKERGRVSLNVYDVLDDYSPIKIIQTLDAISQNIEYVGSNYFTVSFEYKFNNRKATM